MRKIVAIIPAYNEETTIKNVILSLQKYVNKIIVVNDCSIDHCKKMWNLCNYKFI